MKKRSMTCSSDWTAYFGGKGWYGSYDPGKISPSQFIKITAHHSDFEYMIWKMENDKPNNNFGIMRNLLNPDWSATERSYNKKEIIFKDGAW